MSSGINPQPIEEIEAMEEDTGAYAPKLKEAVVNTGEEEEDPILELKAKFFRCDRVPWENKGAVTVKFLKNRSTGQVRLLMRQAETLEICANYFIVPAMTAREHALDEKSCVWQVKNFADGEIKAETFCNRFPSMENCRSFMETFQEVAESQNKGEEKRFVSFVTGHLGNLTLEDDFPEIEDKNIDVISEDKNIDVMSEDKNIDAPAAADGRLKNVASEEKSIDPSAADGGHINNVTCEKKNIDASAVDDGLLEKWTFEVITEKKDEKCPRTMQQKRTMNLEINARPQKRQVTLKLEISDNEPRDQESEKESKNQPEQDADENLSFCVQLSL